MNLSDWSKDDLLRIKEVGLVIRDIALDCVGNNRKVIDTDRTLFECDEFKLDKISNCIILRKRVVDVNDWAVRFSFAVNIDEFTDKRQFSTRYQADTKRFCIRRSLYNSIMKVNSNNVWYTNPCGTEEYIDVLQERDDIHEMEGEIFQRSLVLDDEEMNAAIMNYLFRQDVPYLVLDNADGCVVSDPREVLFIGYAQELDTMLDAYDYLDELKGILC